MSDNYFPFNEDTRVKIPATIHFLRLGYKYVSYTKSLNNGYIDKNTKIFRNIFKESISRINKKEFSDSEINDIISEIHTLISFNDLGKEFYKWLTNPIDKVKLIDFENVDNNSFSVVTELVFGEQELGSFRPDINVLINGIPLAFLEVKKPNNEGGIQVEFDRMIKKRYEQSEHKKYFNLIQLTCFSNNMPYESDDDRDGEPKQGSFYSTPNGIKTTFNFFREERKKSFVLNEDNDEDIYNLIKDNNYNPNIVETEEYKTNIAVNTPCNSFITSLFSKERILFFIKYGILYVDKDVKEKHIMRYPQFFAAQALLDRLKSGKKSGIIWHTQGSGKTALAVYCNKILRDYYSKQGINTRFFYVVDRLDLLTQTTQEFASRGIEVTTVDSKDDFARELNRAIDQKKNQSASGNCVIVNIQKFTDSMPEVRNDYNAKVQRIVFVDEAHRSYSKSSGEFYKNLMLVDRDAIFIAMTGTPLLSKKERSNLRFGDYIHKYFYDRSILDGYTLKIKKEEMETVVKADIKRNLELELKNKDKAKILESDEYICALGKYIDNDFMNFRYINGDNTIGAMIVCSSNPQAKKMQTWFEKNSKFNTRLVISDEDIPTQVNKDNQDDFKSPNRGVDIIIVHLMLTTGYDVPRLKKMYLLRAPKEHSLLQTISRVNRPYKNPNGKLYQYGYISDFVDITEEYDRTVANYLKELNEELVDPDDPNDLGDDGKLIFDVEKIKKKYNEALNKLDDIYDHDNLELYSKFLQKINDKNPLFTLRKLINTILDCKTELLLSHEDDFAQKIDKKHFKALNKLVQDRIDFLNVCYKPIDVMSLLNKDIAEIIFKFVKTKTIVLDMHVKVEIKEKIRQLYDAVRNIKNKDDVRVIKLDDLLKEAFNSMNIGDLDSDELSEELRKAIEEANKINQENELLAANFDGNYAYVKMYQDMLKSCEEDKETNIMTFLKITKKAIDEIEKNNSLILTGRTNFINNVKSQITKDLLLKGIYKDLDLKSKFDLYLGQLFVYLQLY